MENYVQKMDKNVLETNGQECFVKQIYIIQNRFNVTFTSVKCR